MLAVRGDSGAREAHGERRAAGARAGRPGRLWEVPPSVEPRSLVAVGDEPTVAGDPATSLSGGRGALGAAAGRDAGAPAGGPYPLRGVLPRRGALERGPPGDEL